VGDRAVCLSGWLEAPHRVDGEGPLEEHSETGIRELLLHRGRGRIRQRHETESGVTHGLKTVSHIRMCGKGQKARKIAPTIVRGGCNTASRRGHVKGGTADAREIGVRAR